MSKNGHRTDYSLIRDAIHRDIANKFNENEKKKNYSSGDEFNRQLMNQGQEWFDKGLELEDACESLRTNRNFINGFNRAKRLKDIAEYQYNLGMQYARSGVSLDQIPEKHKNKPNVIKGYEDGAKTKRSK